jgi:protein SCO1/2
MRLVVFLLALGVAIFCAGCGGGGKTAAPTTSTPVHPAQPPLHGAMPTPPPLVPEFRLKDQLGRTFGLKQPPGHWVFVTFLYTKCPDVCPLIATTLNNVLGVNIAKHAGLEVLAVSIDPKNDTPAAVKAYIKNRGLLPRFHYLIGTRKELEPVWRNYQVAVLPRTGGVGHTAWELLIDPRGRERVIYASNAQPTDIIVDLARLTGFTG